jgi:hypothetical protein
MNASGLLASVEGGPAGCSASPGGRATAGSGSAPGAAPRPQGSASRPARRHSRSRRAWPTTGPTRFWQIGGRESHHESFQPPRRLAPQRTSGSDGHEPKPSSYRVKLDSPSVLSLSRCRQKLQFHKSPCNNDGRENLVLYRRSGALTCCRGEVALGTQNHASPAATRAATRALPLWCPRRRPSAEVGLPNRH